MKFKNIKCDTGETAKDYNEYLQTKHWKELRQKVAEGCGYVCARCQGTFRNDFHIHHNNYKRLGHENISDLTFYCNRCHKYIHNNRNKVHSFNREYSSIIASKMSKLNEEQILKVVKFIDTISEKKNS